MTTGQIQLRRGTAATWTSANPTLASGEVGVETDTSLVKIGDGTTVWTSLKYDNVGPVSNAGANGQALLKSTGGATWTTLTLSSFTTVVVETPEAHGAKRDGKVVNDAAMTSGSNVLTCATSTPFVAGDVGKPILVCGCGASGGTLIGTIHSRTSSAVVTIYDPTNSSPLNAGTTGSSKAAIWGTDDTAAIKTAVNNAVSAGQANGQNYAEVWFTAGIYMIAGALDTTQSGRAQIPLPFISMTGPKFILNFVGSGDGALIPHWRQNVMQSGGPTLVTTNMAAYDATHGLSSVIGGPTFEGQGSPASPGARFMNMKLVAKGIFFVNPQNPTGWALDLQCVAQCDLDKIGFNACVIPAQDASFANTAYTQFPTFGAGGGGALRMPAVGNNDFCHVGGVAVEGYDIAIWISEHAHIETATLVYCQIGVYVGEGMNDAALIDYLSTEVCGYHIDVPSATAAYLIVTTWDVEDGTGGMATTYHLNDPNSEIFGDLSYKHNANTAPVVNGGYNARIVNRGTGHGYQGSPPTVPASGAARANPFYRDAFVYVTGGTLGGATPFIMVGAPGFLHSTGVTSGMVMVPSGLSIQLGTTYTGSPTWIWFLV